MKILIRIAKFFKPHYLAILFILALSISVSFTEAGLALFVKPIFDEVFFGKNRSFLKWIPIALLSMVFLKGAIGYIHAYTMVRICTRVMVQLRETIFEHYLKLSLSQFEHTPAGHMMSRITADVSGLQATVPTFINLVRQIFTLFALLTVALYRDWYLTLIGLSVVPFTAIPVYFVGENLKRNQRQSLRSMGSLNTIAAEAFTGIRVVKVFGTEHIEADKFKKENEHFVSIVINNMLVGLSASPITEFLTTIGVSAVFVLGGLHAVRGEVTPGEFFSFIAAIFLMYRPIKGIGNTNKMLQVLLAGGERVFQALDEVPDVVNKPDALPLPPLEKEISFNNVWFRYPPPQRRIMGEENIEVVEKGVVQDWAIEDVSFKIRKGETVALVGSSGSGKTSTAGLLPRFYDVTEGSITIDGHDLRDVTFQSLRSQVALVSQETFLFNESVRDNIGYGVPYEVSDEKIFEAAKAADAHDFIMQLPYGYHTPIGERGIKISGGQRQRLAIARALLRNSPILILDEATSSLDTEAEQEVQKALEVLMSDRTTLVIAHRLSTIRNATRIIVLDKGRIVEEGNHEDLIARNGIYKYLYELQFFGESSDKSACG